MEDTKLSILLGYLARGWALVPLHDVGTGVCSCREGPACRSAGKHPRFRAWQEASQLVRDGGTLAALHGAHPGWNWGIATGSVSHLWVLDYDPAHADEASAALVVRLRREQYPPYVETGGGGEHWYFALPDGMVVRNFQASKRLGAGLDARGEGGQVVAPPSVSGKGAYRWLASAEVSAAPGWLTETVTALAAPAGPRTPALDGGMTGAPDGAGATGARGPAYARAALHGVCAELAAAVEGDRNNTAYRAACRTWELVNAGWLTAEAGWEAYAEAGRTCGLGEGELAGVWNGAARRMAGHVATLPPGWGPDVVPFGPAPEAGSTPAGQQAGAEVVDPFEAAVEAAVWKLAVADEARRRYGAAKARRAAAELGAVVPIGWRELFERDHSAVAWLPGRLFERGQQVALVGEGKSGKSLLALDLAWRAACGKDFLQYTGCDPVRVLYVDRENAQRDIAQRLVALGAHPDELDRLGYYSFPVMAYLDESGDDLMTLVERHGAELVVVDTVSRFVAGEENDSDTWLALYRNVHMRLKAAGVAVVRLDHFGKDTERGSRGSSAKSQDIDHVWEVDVLSTTRDGARESAKLRLTRAHTRSGIGDGVYDVDRVGTKDARGELWLPGGTSHTLAVEIAKVWSGEGVREVAARLDAAGVPRFWGREKIKPEGAKLGIRQSNEMWSHVARYRKEQHRAQLHGVQSDGDESGQDGFVDPA